MTSSNNPPNSADQDDPWEELADLVGLEGGKEYVASPPPAPVSSAPPANVPAPVDFAPRERDPEPFAAPVRDNPPDVTFAAEPEAAFEDAESPEPTASSDSPEPAAHTASTSAQDSYWDALANWNWDDSDGGAGKARPEPERSAGGPPPRGGAPRGRDDKREKRGGDRPPRSSAPPATSSRPPASSSPPPRAPRAAAPAAGDDFGLGVGDEPDDFSSPHAAPAADSRSGAGASEPPAVARDSARLEGSGSRGEDRPKAGDRGPAEGVEGDGTKKRRRRRRRRGGRGGDREQAGSPQTSAAALPATDWDDSAGPESDFVDEPETPAPPAPARPVEDSSSDRSSRPPRGRHRDSRPEGPARRPAPERAERSDDHFEDEEPQEISMGGGALVPDIDDEGDDESGEPLVSYENIPSWEEAISYLLHPSQVQVEPGAGTGSSPPRGPAPPDQPRQTRHIGNRKPRR